VFYLYRGEGYKRTTIYARQVRFFSTVWKENSSWHAS